MPFYADLHLHSKYSRATSRDCDLEHLAYWAMKKGIAVIGTGDFTHPAWFAEIRDKLRPAESGLFRLRGDVERKVQRALGSRVEPTRFMLSVEISTIYKKDEKTRRIHHLIYVPTLRAAEKIRRRLGRIGNIESDGRPILGLDSRNLLETVLESDPDSYLIPAHIWTPWFAVLGSQSGFDSIEACYGDLSREIFAIETGLSSDPPMNWRVSALDRYQLVSNSDAHSPAKLGREACIFESEMNYYAMKNALQTGDQYGGTVEFFPEEGKYHLDGHRNCGISLSPEKTNALEGRCPACGGRITVGVLHRVQALADRLPSARIEGRKPYRHLIPLTEILAEMLGLRPAAKRVQAPYEDLVSRLGSELFILEACPREELKDSRLPLLGEAISRMRKGEISCQSGYDGEYGKIRLFEPHELGQG